MENNLNAINDFKQLLLETRQEINQDKNSSSRQVQLLQYGIVLPQIEAVIKGFDAAKHSIKSLST